MDAPHGHTAKILELAADLRAIADKIERETSASIVESGEWTRSAVAGLPCSGEVQWNQRPETATHDVAPPDDGFSVHDDPPSRPLP